jgi:hypothetical protein
MGSNSSKNKNNLKDINLDLALNKSLLNISSNIHPEQIADYIINLYANSDAKHKDSNISIFYKSIIDMLNILKNQYILDLEKYNPYKKNNIVLTMFLKDIIYIINKVPYDDKFNIRLGGYFLNKLKIQKYICDLIDLYQEIKINDKFINQNLNSLYYTEVMLLSQSYTYDINTQITEDILNKNISYIKKLIINSILI